MRAFIGLAVLLLVIAACAQQAVIPGPTYTPPSTISEGKPNIPRVAGPEEPEQPRIEQRPPAPVILTNRSPSTDLKVPFGDSLGEYYPIIGKTELSILRHQPIRIHNNLLLGYEELLLFPDNTSYVRFGQDRETEEIGSFLMIKEGNQIFEYVLKLDRDTFYNIQGRNIQILGHTYRIAEATNTTVTFFGVDVANNLQFIDGKKLVVNTTNQQNTIAKVKPGQISYKLFADEDTLLGTDDRLSDKVGQNKLASQFFDVIFRGVPAQDSVMVEFDRTTKGFALGADYHTGRHKFTILERQNGQLFLGRDNKRVHLRSCGLCIAPDDTVVIVTPSKKTYILQYEGAGNDWVTFEDQAQNKYSYKYVDNKTQITLDGYTFRVTIGPKINDGRNISVEGLTNELRLRDGSIVKIGSINGNTLPIEVKTSARYYGRSSIPERTIRLNLTYNNDWVVQVEGLPFIEEEKSDDTISQMDTGTAVILKRETGPLNEGTEAKILIPTSQMYGIIGLER
jgi:hypothetical protein